MATSLSALGPRPDGGFDTFLSYSRHDANFARQLGELLMANGLRVWFDEYQIAKMTEPDPAERVTQIPELLAAGVARSCSAILLTNQQFAKSRHCVTTEAAALLAKTPAIPVLHLGLPADAQTTAQLKNVLPCHLPPPEDVSSIGECLPRLERFFGRKLRPTMACHPEAFKAKEEQVTWGIGPARFYFANLDWEFRRPLSASHPDERSGPSVVKRFAACEVDINLLVGKTGLKRAELEKRFAEETKDSRWTGYEMAIGLAQGSFVGPSRLDAGKKKEFSGFTFLQKLKTYGWKLKLALIRWFLGRKAVGIHLFQHQGLDQFAITYWTRSVGWTRKYCLRIPDPAGLSDYELIFTGGFRGADWQIFLEHVPVMDHYVGSLRTALAPEETKR